ncbi:hypothetical protein WJX73_008195 [Symbiochloris irregularis]|uniref:Dioxygenase n=1 Tax=Symbiochloris irregularis TaxID=706552 RepID=A0AAW1NZD1_9CHLO
MQVNQALRDGGRDAVKLSTIPPAGKRLRYTARSQKRIARLSVLPEPAGSFNTLLPQEERDVSQLIFEGEHWASAFVTQPNEYDYDITEVEGEVPAAIRGTLFRNGPGNFERGDQAYEHMLDGDGYICSFKFQDDGVSFHSRYVRTSELEMEEKAGQVLFRNTFGTQRRGTPVSDNWLSSSVIQPAVQSLQEAVHRGREQVQAAADASMTAGKMQLSGTFPGQVQPVGGTNIWGDILQRIARTIEPVVSGLQENVLPAMQQVAANAASITANAMDLRLKNPVNTNVVLWGGRLLALWEAGSPCELDPATLATTGERLTLGGFVQPGMAPSSTGWAALDRRAGLGSALTAHPHIEPATDGHGQRMVMWNWRSVRGQDLVINVAEYDEQWQQQAATSFKMHNSMFNPHDFAFTPRHHVFFQNAMSMDMASYILGLKGPAQCVEVLAEQPMNVHIVPRDGSPAQVLSTESSFLIHHANAFEDGEDIVVWSSGWAPSALQALKRGQGMLGSWKTVLRGDFGGIPFTSMLEHRINARTGQVTRKVLFNTQNADHPKVNSSFYSKPTRYLYFNGSNGPDHCSNPPQAFGRVDTHTGEFQSWSPGRHCFCEELIFVPGPDGATDELDGYLLGMVYDGARHCSSLAIMDARDFSQGPVCRLWLKHHVPHGLHGFFTEQQF